MAVRFSNVLTVAGETITRGAETGFAGGPGGPGTPGSPWTPLCPRGPAGPLWPGAPCRPRFPGGPLLPLIPFCPSAPGNPLGPGGPGEQIFSPGKHNLAALICLTYCPSILPTSLMLIVLFATLCLCALRLNLLVTARR